jgi:hypothetical protein
MKHLLLIVIMLLTTAGQQSLRHAGRTREIPQRALPRNGSYRHARNAPRDDGVV